ncbi:MAG TPA: hypothetical protein VLI05_03345 [Candidatus Saccharimonadia bacterium]|nr:hypothetical protein [Candidatus Saccharimonadia bacterium]
MNQYDDMDLNEGQELYYDEFSERLDRIDDFDDEALSATDPLAAENATETEMSPMPPDDMVSRRLADETERRAKTEDL